MCNGITTTNPSERRRYQTQVKSLTRRVNDKQIKMNDIIIRRDSWQAIAGADDINVFSMNLTIENLQTEITELTDKITCLTNCLNGQCTP